MKVIKSFLDIILGSKATFEISKLIYQKRIFPFIHSVTYHDTPTNFKENFRNQLTWYKKNYVDTNLSDLLAFLKDGTWKHEKPGLIISFDDGLRSNFDVALPLLEEFGFTGWFMVPVGLVDIPPAEQQQFAKEQQIDFFAEKNVDPRIIVSWEEIREMEERGHIITCHSMFHNRLSDKLSMDELKTEIIGSKNKLERKLQHTIDMFTWVGGEDWAYSKGAFKMMMSAEYKLIFCTNCAPITPKNSPFFLQRYHVEPFYKLNRLRFVLGGVYDFLYVWKRRRVFKNIA
jgi:peptidoglycan/xylan/chitin deacetylase (PgdA/CDA1 family)